MLKLTKTIWSSSKKTDQEQLSFLNEAEKELRYEKEEPSVEEITYK
ncbi:hypothetical protein GOQ29_13455 [Clostridium sp. D2Q-14]|nr:hypothetical protein [Anaeromonas gelatinilytica]MBS4536625.1 hypothetical protein [Anaeromonas gelatinilytica]